MQPTREELKKQLLAQAENTIEQFLNWMEQSPAPTLTQIEDAVLQFRQQLGQQMAETAIRSQDSVSVAPGPTCPQCGQEMRTKAKKEKRLTSRVGELQLKRSHYYCPRCCKGLFPPR